MLPNDPLWPPPSGWEPEEWATLTTGLALLFSGRINKLVEDKLQAQRHEPALSELLERLRAET